LIKGYIEYKKREFCKDNKCLIQNLMDKQVQESSEYEELRNICKKSCIHTTYEFHHWLINKGYLLIRHEK